MATFVKGQVYDVVPGSMHTSVTKFRVTRVGLAQGRVEIEILEAARPEFVGQKSKWNAIAVENCKLA